MSAPPPSPPAWSTTADAPRLNHRRWIALLALGALLIGAGVGLQRVVFARMLPLAQVATGYMARVGCACHFIAGRSLESCLMDREAGMERVILSVDAPTRTVTARVPLLARRSGRHEPGAGCILLP